MSITSFTLKSTTTQANAPFSIGHAFKKGDVPAGSQLVSGLSEMQVVSKNTWPDGSLKFAVISGKASLTANTPLTVTLTIGTPAGGTALTTADLKATGVVASLALSNTKDWTFDTASQTVGARLAMSNVKDIIDVSTNITVNNSATVSGFTSTQDAGTDTVVLTGAISGGTVGGYQTVTYTLKHKVVRNISTITKATTARITCTEALLRNGRSYDGLGNNFIDIGNTFTFSGITGMTQLNGMTGTVTAIDNDSNVGQWLWFEVNIDTTGFSTYTSGGTATKNQLNTSTTTTVAYVRSFGGISWDGTQNTYSSSNTVFQSGVSWATTDWDTPFQTVVNGPKMSSWTYRKAIGSDPHLVAWLEVRLWAGGAVEVLPWIENGYLLVSGPTSKSATYNFSLGGTSRCSVSVDMKHHQRTPIINGPELSYWLGTDPGVTAMVNTTYLQTTELVPTYSVTTSAAGRTNLKSTYVPLAVGGFHYVDNRDGPDVMSNPGYQPCIGILPEHDVLFLVGNDQPELRYTATIRNGYYAGKFGIHYRDETTNKPAAFSSYPTLVMWGGSGFGDNGASTTGTYTPAVVGGNTPSGWDTAHHPSVGFMAYLLTGHQYHLETSQFAVNASWFAINNNNVRANSTGRFIPDYGAVQTRAAAWGFRSLTQAFSITPDADTVLRGEYKAVAERIINYYHATFVAQTNNQFGIIEPGETYDSVNGAWMGAIWQQDFFTAAYGYALAADIPVDSTVKTKLASFFAWKAKSIVGRLGTSADFWYINADPYTMAYSPTSLPNFQNGTGPWYADWKATYDATYFTPYVWQSSTEGVLGGEYTIDGWMQSLWGNLHPAIAYAVRHGVPGAQTGYDRMRAASNYATAASYFNANPVWAVQPASTSSAPPAVLDPKGVPVRVDSNSLVTGMVVCGNRAYGVLASSVPSSGRDGAAAGYNWLSLPTDANVHVRWVPEPLPSGMFMNEDGSFKYTGANTTVNLRGYVDGVDIGTAPLILSVTTVPITITCTVGNANAAGRTAIISTANSVVISCTVGNANAAGSTATISTPTGSTPVTISCSVGNANAAGLTANITNLIGNVTISCTVGNALAQGQTAAVILGSGGIGIGDRLEIRWDDVPYYTYQINRVRGDTYADQGVVNSKRDGLPVDLSGCTLTMTLNSVRNPVDNSTEIYQLDGIMIDAVNGVVGFAPNSQQADIVGLFYYDVQLVDVSGIVRTLVKDVYVYEEDITKN